MQPFNINMKGVLYFQVIKAVICANFRTINNKKNIILQFIFQTMMMRSNLMAVQTQERRHNYDGENSNIKFD